MSVAGTSMERRPLSPEPSGSSHSIPPPSPSLSQKDVPNSYNDSDGELQDVDDDARFSMIPLQTPGSTPRARNFTDGEGSSLETSMRINRASFSSVAGQKSPKASLQALSTNSIQQNTPPPSSGNSVRDSTLSVLMARQKERLDSDPHARRASIDGHGRLREDFERLQLDTQLEETQIDWDFWGSVMADYETTARDESARLAKAIEQGIPSALRGHIWQLMSVSKDLELEQMYSDFLKQPSSYEKAIMRDLGRTFPHHAFFTEGKGIGQENLFNVLKAYSLYDPEVGYCQGLAFIVAVLLLNMPDEEAFCVFVRLMHSYNLRTIYLPEMPGLQLRLYQFDRLVEEILPVVYVHFLRQGVKSSMYCSQWFLTMFSYRFPLPIVYRIFDHLFATGIESIFGFSIVLLQANEAQLLNLKFDGILEYLKSALFDAYLDEVAPTPKADSPKDEQATVAYQADRYVQDALRVRITPFQLDNYASEWDELRRAQNAHAVEMDNLRQSNRALQSHVKSLEDALAQMNEDHVDIVKELVMAKVEKEDMEAELVKYKVLYAEQMHASEDAGSSTRMSSMSRLSGWSTLGRSNGK